MAASNQKRKPVDVITGSSDRYIEVIERKFIEYCIEKIQKL